VNPPQVAPVLVVPLLVLVVPLLVLVAPLLLWVVVPLSVVVLVLVWPPVPEVATLPPQAAVEVTARAIAPAWKDRFVNMVVAPAGPP
jgi:hypothetical protein